MHFLRPSLDLSYYPELPLLNLSVLSSSTSYIPSQSHQESTSFPSIELSRVGIALALPCLALLIGHLCPYNHLTMASQATDIRTASLQEPVDVAEYLFTRLKQIGCQSVHGLPGDFNLVALDYIPKSGLKWVGNANELNAGMSDSSPTAGSCANRYPLQLMLPMAMPASRVSLRLSQLSVSGSFRR